MEDCSERAAFCGTRCPALVVLGHARTRQLRKGRDQTEARRSIGTDLTCVTMELSPGYFSEGPQVESCLETTPRRGGLLVRTAGRGPSSLGTDNALLGKMCHRIIIH